MSTDFTSKIAASILGRKEVNHTLEELAFRNVGGRLELIKTYHGLDIGFYATHLQVWLKYFKR